MKKLQKLIVQLIFLTFTFLPIPGQAQNLRSLESVPASINTAIGVVADPRGYAYVQTDSGVTGVNATLPNNPFAMWSISAPAWDLALDRNLLVLGLGGNGTSIVDVSNPNNPQQVGSSDAIGCRVTAKNSYAYLIDTFSSPYRLRILDLLNPSSPIIKGEVALTGTPNDIAIYGNYAYIPATDRFLVIDISNPSSPQIANTITTTQPTHIVAGNAWLALDGMVTTVGAIQVAGLSNPVSPNILSELETNCYFNRLAVQGNFIFTAFHRTLSRSGGLRIFDISSGQPAVVANLYTTGTPYGVSPNGNYAYFADGDAGLEIMDVTNPTAPKIIGIVAKSLISKSVDKSRANPGETLTYTINYQNDTTQKTNAKISDSMLTNVCYIKNSAMLNGIPVTDTADGDIYTFNNSTKEAIWNIGNMAAGSMGIVSYKVIVASNGYSGCSY